MTLLPRAGHFRLGVGFLNRTGAEIGCKLDKKNAKKSYFIIENIQKYRKYPALGDSVID